MTSRTWISALLLLVASCSSGPEYAQLDGDIAMVIRTVGVPTVERNARPYMLGQRSEIFAGDVIRTGTDAAAVIRLPDGTPMTVGPGSHLRVSRVETDGSHLRFELNLSEGGLEIASGLTTPQIRLGTTTAIIQSDGAGFWVSYERVHGHLQVVSLGGSPVTISNRDGTVVLEERLDASSVAPGVAPNNVTRWSASRFESERRQSLGGLLMPH